MRGSLNKVFTSTNVKPACETQIVDNFDCDYLYLQVYNIDGEGAASVEVSEWRPPGAGCSLASAASAVHSCTHHNIAGYTLSYCHSDTVILSYS